MAEIFEEFAQQQMEGCSSFVFPNIYDIFFVVSASSKPFQTLFLRLISYILLFHSVSSCPYRKAGLSVDTNPTVGLVSHELAHNHGGNL